MADDHADATVVDGIVGVLVEERGLKDASGEHDLVHLWAVVGIDGLRCHEPFLFINRFAKFVHFKLVLETDGAVDVLEIRLGGDGVFCVVFPFVGITHLHIDAAEFVQGLVLGVCAHPIEGFDAFAQGDLQVGYEGFHAFFG